MTTLSGRGSRVQQVSRLLYKKNPMTSRADCVTSGVKRLHSDSFVTVGDATLGKPTGDVSVKKKQAWRYPGGIIQRYESTMINGRRYYDHIDTSEPRRKQESNFFITINTNRKGSSTAAAPNLEQEGRVAIEKALKDLAKDQFICKYLKFGPKHPGVYGDDRYEDVIQSVEWTANVEMGDFLERLHCHIWMTVHHYSQVQINMRMMQQLFKVKYHEHLGGLLNPNWKELQINGLPYIQVKLLPTANWAEVMKQYIHKGMVSSNPTTAV